MRRYPLSVEKTGFKKLIKPDAILHAQQVTLLTPLSEKLDSGGKLGAGERFFAMVKNMTADGYYTSQVGLVRELGYSGNTALDKFPSCEIPEH